MLAFGGRSGLCGPVVRHRGLHRTRGRRCRAAHREGSDGRGRQGDVQSRRREGARAARAAAGATSSRRFPGTPSDITRTGTASIPRPPSTWSGSAYLEGAEEFERREAPGVADVKRIFGTQPVCYGQPGSSWGPQTNLGAAQTRNPGVSGRRRSGGRRRAAILVRRAALRLPAWAGISFARS